MKTKLALLVSSCSLLLVTSVASAEDIGAIFQKVGELTEAGNYTKALEELGWAQKELQKKHVAKIQSLLPDEVEGFTGAKGTASGAFGVSTIEKKYSKGSDKITLSLVGSAKGAAGGMGGLAALGNLGAMMGNQQGSDTFRLDGRTATLTVRGKKAELSVFLEGGSILKLEQRNASDEGAALKKVAEALKIGDLDNYLKGQVAAS